MKINLLHPYRGKPTRELLLLAGEQEVAPELGAYLVYNGHAVLVDVVEVQPEVVEDVAAEDATETAPEVTETDVVEVQPEVVPAPRRRGGA